MARSVPEDQRVAAVRRVLDGEDERDVAHSIGVGLETLQRWRRERTDVKFGQHHPPADKAVRREAVRRYGAGDDVDDIAYDLDIHPDTVKRWSRKDGVKRTHPALRGMRIPVDVFDRLIDAAAKAGMNRDDFIGHLLDRYEA